VGEAVGSAVAEDAGVAVAIGVGNGKKLQLAKTRLKTTQLSQR
jgi:hypothetical protein